MATRDRLIKLDQRVKTDQSKNMQEQANKVNIQATMPK